LIKAARVEYLPLLAGEPIIFVLEANSPKADDVRSLLEDAGLGD
jgi:hypothetical protein